MGTFMYYEHYSTGATAQWTFKYARQILQTGPEDSKKKLIRNNISKSMMNSSGGAAAVCVRGAFPSTPSTLFVWPPRVSTATLSKAQT